MACTWDPSNKGANITLSAGNLKMTGSGTGQVRSTLGYSSGSGSTNASTYLYFEITSNNTQSVGPAIGVANGSSTLADYPGGDANSAGNFGGNSHTLQNGTDFAIYATWATNTTVGIAVDFFHQLIWFTVDGTTWNNAAIGSQNPVGAVGGFYSPNSAVMADVFKPSGSYTTVYPCAGAFASGDALTANFTGPFSYTVPTGFSPWDPGVSGGLTDFISPTDSFALSAIGLGLSDALSPTDSYSGNTIYVLNVSDLISTSDAITVESGSILGLTFDGLVRETLYTHFVASELTFNGLLRETLYSAGSSGSSVLKFDGLVREALVLSLPPNPFAQISAGPIPTFPLFPTLPQGFPVKMSPSMDTIIGTTKSLREMRVPQRIFPLWDFELLFEELRDQTQNQAPYIPFLGYTQYTQLVQLWLQMYGQTGVFAFDAPWDNSREEQTIGTGDGSTYIFTIYRTWGINATATEAPIGLINTVTDVKVNGTTVPTSQYYTSGNRLYFAGPDGFQYPPVNDGVITMTFTFYYLCRFVEDEQDFEQFSLNRWTVPSLKFRAVNWIFG